MYDHISCDPLESIFCLIMTNDNTGCASQEEGLVIMTTLTETKKKKKKGKFVHPETQMKKKKHKEKEVPSVPAQ